MNPMRPKASFIRLLLARERLRRQAQGVVPALQVQGHGIQCRRHPRAWRRREASLSRNARVASPVVL